MREIEKYFTPGVFAPLCLTVPATIIIVTFFLGAFNIHLPFEKVMNLQRTHNLVSWALFMCIASILLTFIDLIVLNYSASQKHFKPEFIMNKSYFNTALIAFPYFYFIILFFFIELDKFGNIPVGRN